MSKDGNTLTSDSGVVNTHCEERLPDSAYENEPPIDSSCDYSVEPPAGYQSEYAEGPLPLSERKRGLDVPAKVARPTFKLVALSEMEVTAPEYLINGILETDSFSAIVGDPASAKSFLAIDIASCVATGTRFHGKEICRQGPVVYIAGEGQSGIARRFSAWGIKNGIDYKTIPVHVSLQPGQLVQKESTDSIISAIESIPDGPPVLVVIDTLARNFGPGDENNTADMTEFIQAVDRIREHGSGATILIIHHCGLSDKRRGRGSSALRGALDSEYLISKDENGTRRFECGKMKDATPPEPMAFKLRSVELGMDDRHGNPVTSAVLDVVEYEQPSQTGKPGRGKNQLAALSILEKMVQGSREELERNGYKTDRVHTSYDKWRDTCISGGIAQNAFWKLQESLCAMGAIKCGNGLVEILAA